ncbi:MAG: tetratricopeptide repeat protein [Magnetococcales bacterium]|nr:tetratricopeptide repeat protein [Magnetococcales bacterium]
MKVLSFVMSMLLSAWMLTGCTTGSEINSGEGESFVVAKRKGEAYLERGSPDQALPALRRARELQPDDVEVLLLLGMAYDQSDRPLQAVETLEKAHQLRPDDGKINNNLGVARMRMDRLEAALGNFETALKDASFSTPEEIYYNLALLYKRLGRQREMESTLEKALTVKPGFVPALLELAGFHRDMGRADLELIRLRQILVASPGFVEAMERLADLYLSMKKNREARELLQKISSQDSGGPSAQRAKEKLAILDKMP